MGLLKIACQLIAFIDLKHIVLVIVAAFISRDQIPNAVIVKISKETLIRPTQSLVCDRVPSEGVRPSLVVALLCHWGTYWAIDFAKVVVCSQVASGSNLQHSPADDEDTHSRNVNGRLHFSGWQSGRVLHSVEFSPESRQLMEITLRRWSPWGFLRGKEGPTQANLRALPSEDLREIASWRNEPYQVLLVLKLCALDTFFRCSRFMGSSWIVLWVMYVSYYSLCDCRAVQTKKGKSTYVK